MAARAWHQWHRRQSFSGTWIRFRGHWTGWPRIARINGLCRAVLGLGYGVCGNYTVLLLLMLNYFIILLYIVLDSTMNANWSIKQHRRLSTSVRATPPIWVLNP